MIANDKPKILIILRFLGSSLLYPRFWSTASALEATELRRPLSMVRCRFMILTSVEKIPVKENLGDFWQARAQSYIGKS